MIKEKTITDKIQEFKTEIEELYRKLRIFNTTNTAKVNRFLIEHLRAEVNKREFAREVLTQLLVNE